MPPRKVDVPPIFYDSRPSTLIIIALSVHGNMTKRELSRVTTLEKSRVTRLLNQLKQRKLAIDYKWGGSPMPGHNTKIPSRDKMWALDPHHPLFLRIGDLARCLARKYPTPRDRLNKGPRRYHGPRLPKYDLPADDLKVFGEKPIARTLMLLCWARNVPVEKMTALLGRGRGTRDSLALLESYEIISTRWLGSQHQASLKRAFCAYWSLLELGRAIDRATGLEYKPLARARRASFNRERLSLRNRRIGRAAAKRKTDPL